MSGAALVTLAVVAGLLVQPTSAADFLHAGQVNTTQLESNLLSELANALRPGSSNTRISGLKGELFQLFKSVPAESDGTLNHHVVRYILHRFFTQKHGWFIRGLEPDGDHRDDATDESHALTDLQEWVPGHLQSFLEQLNRGKGLSLKEVAVFAATLEDLIHKEANERHEQAWKALNLPLDQPIYSSQVMQVLELYMIIYNQNGDLEASTPEEVKEQIRSYGKAAKDWPLTQAWLRKTRMEVFPTARGATTLNFTEVSHLVEELGERFGAFNDDDCNKLKTELREIESPKRAGRISLPQFYKKGLYSNWEFNEKKEYLRSLGALDESDPKQPSVILPNYLASRPNCLVSSNYYVVCCRNECEDIMTRIEAEMYDHTVRPDTLLRLIPTISSDTIKAPRKLSNTLMDRLRQVADANGGKVPIHGRLFAQWMHHAFPRECPYPHEAGTTSPQTPDEWMKSAGHDSHTASEEERQAHADSHDENGEEEVELPWTFTEELLTRRVSPVQQTTGSRWRANLRKIAVLGVIGAMLGWTVLQWRSTGGKVGGKIGGLKYA